MIKKTIAGKAAEILNGLQDDGFEMNDYMGILFVALREITLDDSGAIDRMKDYFCDFMDKTKNIKRDDF